MLDISWMEEFYDVEYEVTDARVVASLIKCIEETIEIYGLSGIDELLKSVELNRLQPVFMVTLIRSSFSYRQHLDNWIDCRDRIAINLMFLDHDSKKILHGLY